jgi:hypothetical protein
MGLEIIEVAMPENTNDSRRLFPPENSDMKKWNNLPKEEFQRMTGKHLTDILTKMEEGSARMADHETRIVAVEGCVKDMKAEKKGWNNAVKLIVILFGLVSTFWAFWMLFKAF